VLTYACAPEPFPGYVQHDGDRLIGYSPYVLDDDEYQTLCIAHGLRAIYLTAPPSDDMSVLDSDTDECMLDSYDDDQELYWIIPRLHN